MIVGIALLMSLLTLYSMIKIWNQAFWKTSPEGESRSHQVDQPAWMMKWVPVLTLTILILVLGLVAEPFLKLTQQAADQILIPGEYIQTVLGGGI